MKARKGVFGVVFIFTILWASESIAQGNIYTKELVKKEMKLNNFSAIEVSGLAQIYLSEGTETNARLEVSGVPINDVKVIVEEGTLHISTRGDYNGESIKIYITYIKIEKLLVTDSAEIFSNGPIKTNSLEISSLDAGKAVLDIDVNLVKILMKDSADLTLTGYAKNQKISSRSKNGKFDNSGLQLKQ